MLYIFFGPDSFSRREALERLKADLDRDGMLSANTSVFDARQVSLQEVIVACDTMPFLSSHRLVVLEGLLQHTGQSAGSRPSQRRPPRPGGAMGPWQALVDYVARMAPTTTLVILDGDVPRASPLLDALKDKGQLRRFRPPERGALPGWVQRRAQGLGLRIDKRAVALLTDLVGDDLRRLASELEKLAAYAAGQPVLEEDVRALVSGAWDVNVFALVDAIVEGRSAVALRLLRRMLTQGQTPAYVFAMIQRQYRHLAIARAMVDTGSSERRIGEQLGLSGYGLEKLLEQTSRYPLPHVRAAFRHLLEADAAIKRGVYEEELALELLVHGLAAASSWAA